MGTRNKNKMTAIISQNFFLNWKSKIIYLANSTLLK